MLDKKSEDEMETECLENLSNAIIVLAANDLRAALRLLAADPGNRSALKMKNEVESFFLSDWFSKLTNFSGELLLEELIKEVEYGTI